VDGADRRLRAGLWRDGVAIGWCVSRCDLQHVEIFSSARRHGIADDDVRHAVAHAEEAEAGLEISKPPSWAPAMGSGPAESLPVRLEPELRQALDQRAAQDETTPSEVVLRRSASS
jgi:hypothetical protein